MVIGIENRNVILDRRCGKTLFHQNLFRLEGEIKETIKELDTYNVVKQIKLSEKLVKLYTEKARLLGVKT